MLRPTRRLFKPQPGRLLSLNGVYRGLIGAYLFNEGGGNTVWDSVQNVSGAFTNAPTWRASIFGPVINFGSSTASIQGTTRAYDPKTWAFWINDAATTTYAVAAKSDNNTISHGWWIDHPASGQFRFVYENTAANVSVNTTGAAAGAWHFFVITYDGTVPAGAANAQWYQDGLAFSTSVGAAGSGSHTTDGGFVLELGTGPFNNGTLGQLGSFLMWNRVLTAREVLDLYIATYPATQRRPYSAPPPSAPSSDYIFNDSYPYHRALDLKQQAFSRDFIATPPFLQPVAPSSDYYFYDSFPYSRAAQQRQAAFQRNATVDAFWVQVVPTGIPLMGFVYNDSTDYRYAGLRSARFQRDNIAFVNVAPVSFGAPSEDYIFYDSFDYRAAAARNRQAHFDRNAVLNNFQATFSPSYDWPFYDSFNYKTNPLKLAHFQRDYIADAGIIFTAAGPAAVPNFGYDFYDSFDYSRSKRINLGFQRNLVADAAALFTAAVLVVPPQDYIFYDSTNYGARVWQRLQQGFRRDYIADSPPGANIPVPFVNLAGFEPLVTPVSNPVRPRESFFFIGVPNDIRDGTKLPEWNFLQLGDSSRQPVQKREEFRRFYQLVEPYKPEMTFLSVFFTATMAPWAASLNKSAIRNFLATMQAWAGGLSILTQRAPSIVGFMLNVCSESRTLKAIKYTLATVCQDPRTVIVPQNTTPVCMTFVKDPQATTDYNVDWTAPLMAASDRILTSSWATDAGIAIAKSTYVGTVATAFVDGGTEGSSYSVMNTITTAGGLTLAQNFILKIQLR